MSRTTISVLYGSQVAAKAGVSSTEVRNVIIWGNHSSTQYPDLAHAQVMKGGSFQPAPLVIQDDAWANNDFVSVSAAHQIRA